MINTLFFDLDNTLYDYHLAHDAAMKYVYSFFSRNVDIDFDKFLEVYNGAKLEVHRELVGTASSHNRAIYFQRLIEKLDNTVKPAIILELYEKYWESFFVSMKIFPWVMELFKELKSKNIKIAVVTNFTTQVQLRKIDHLGLNKYIDVLVSSEEAGNEKPHPSVFLLAANKLEVLTKNVVMVGDNPVDDIEGANHLNMTTVLLDRKNKKVNYKFPLQKPDYILSDMSKLTSIIEF